MHNDDSGKFVFFWKLGHKNEEFSNWYPCDFIIEGIRYFCVEQYMMAKKALLFDDIAVYQQIMKSLDPSECKNLGKIVKGFDPAVWDKCKYEIVYNANYAKFHQNDKLKKKLIATGRAVMVEASPLDKIWGIGMSADDPKAKHPNMWSGENLLGSILMEIRDQVKNRIRYFSRYKDDESHLYKYDTETGKFFYMDHCWTGEGIWYEREGGYPPEFEIVEISEDRARTISKDNLGGSEKKKNKKRDRSRELNMIKETIQILEQGYYVKDGRKIPLKLSRKEMEEINVYLPKEVRKYSNQSDFNPPYVIGRCGYGCENQDSFSLARERIAHEYLYDNDIPKILVLNLANAVHPGGGVRRGAKAQEEDLCRSSSLLISLESKTAEKYYEYNKNLHTKMGSDALMITPQVEIIRDENGELLDDTVVVSVVTCAAPMVSYGKEGMSDADYKQMMFDRITGLLKSVAYLGYKNLVLGAWGCGAFGNDAAVISDLFYSALKNLDYNGHSQKDLFRRIDFAVLDRTKEQYNFKEFCRNFTHENFYRDEKQQAIGMAMERIRETEVNLDKIRGCIVGGAAGDALGYAIEFSGEKEIFSKYGRRGITEYELDALTGNAVISDDTQMTLFTANGLLVGDTRGCMRGIQGPPRIYVASAYTDWLRTQEMTFEESQKEPRKPMRGSSSWLLDVPELYKRRAPGNTCLSALKYGKLMGDDFIKEHLNNSKGCGGVMRVAPLALNYHWINLEKLDYEGAQIAAITHGHSLGYMPAAVLVHIINRIVFPEREMSLKEIITEAETTARTIFKGDKHLKELTDLIELAVELSENQDSDLDNIHRLGEGWVAEETLAISIYCALRYQDDFSAGIIAAVNHKGDSDSTGAVTGNILGALLGYDAIDDKWKKDLELHDVIIEMADDICHGCQMSEYSDYEDPDWFRKYIGMQWKNERSLPEDSEMDIQDFIQSPGFYEMNKALRNGGLL